MNYTFSELKKDIYKVLLLIALYWIAYSFYGYANNGRYKHSSQSVFYDSRTGKVIVVDQGYENGRVVIKEID